MRKKERIASLICRPILFSGLKKISNKTNLRILAYHRILDIKESYYPFDEELISASIKDFDEQMKYVSQNYNVITFYELIKIIEKGEKIPPHSLIITFDDGYSDNYFNAFPILKKYGLKAVFFLATDYIDTSKTFWFELPVYLGKKNLMEGLYHILIGKLPLGKEKKGGETGLKLRNYLLRIPNHERLKVLKKIETIFDSNIQNSDDKLVKPMDWKQVNELSKFGMEIGSHTKSHLILKNASKEEIVEELRFSKKVIEEKIKKNVISISYPIGNKFFGDCDNVKKIAASESYRWGISYISGVEKIPIRDPFLIKRLKIERYIGIDWFKSLLLFPNTLC